jgi:hypothetical protein
MIQTIETLIEKLIKNPTKYWVSVKEVSGAREIQLNYPIKIKIKIVFQILSDVPDRWELKIEPEHLQPIDIQMSGNEALHMIDLIEDLKIACFIETRNYLKNIILSL